MIPIDPATIDELVTLRANARMAAESFSEAIKAQAEKFNLGKGALRRFICAKEKDDLFALDSEAADIANLLNAAGIIGAVPASAEVSHE